MSQETRNKLLEGARQCLVKEGYQKTSVKAIAKYAEVNHGLVHHYFGSKEELMAALVMQVAEGGVQQKYAKQNMVMPPSNEVSAMNPDELERFAKDRIVPHLTSEYNKFVMELLVMSEEMPEVAIQVRELLQRRRQWFGQIMGVREPSLLLLISGAMMGLMLQYKLDPALDVEKAVIQLFRLISKQGK